MIKVQIRLLLGIFIFLSTFAHSQVKYRSLGQNINKQIIRISADLQLTTDGTFEFSANGCLSSWRSDGQWEEHGDTLILNTIKNKGDYILEVAQISTYSILGEGVDVSFQISRDDFGDQMTHLRGMNNISFLLYSDNQTVECVSDSLGKYRNSKLQFIDSILVKDLYGFKDLKIIWNESKISSLAISIPQLELLERTFTEWDFVFFDEKKWVKKDGLLIELDTGMLYKKVE